MLSARSSPFTKGLSAGDRAASAPNAPSTWNQNVFLPRHVGQGVEIVDGARVHGASRADDHEGRESGRAVGGDGVNEVLDAHGAAFVGRNQAEMPRPEAGQLHRLPHAIMHLARGVGDEHRIQRVETVEPDIPVAGGVFARDQQRQEIGHRRAGDENPRGVRRKTKGLRHPQRDLPLHVERDMVAAAAVGVQPGRQHLADHADRRPRALHPAHEQRMRVADREGLDVAVEFGQRGCEIPAFERKRAAKEGFRLVAGRTPDGTLAHIANVVDHRVQRAMSLRAKRFPVRRVEIQWAAVFKVRPFGIAHVAFPAQERAGAVKAGDLCIRRASPDRSSVWNSGLCPKKATSPRF